MLGRGEEPLEPPCTPSPGRPGSLGPSPSVPLGAGQQASKWPETARGCGGPGGGRSGSSTASARLWPTPLSAPSHPPACCSRWVPALTQTLGTGAGSQGLLLTPAPALGVRGLWHRAGAPEPAGRPPSEDGQGCAAPQGGARPLPPRLPLPDHH